MALPRNPLSGWVALVMIVASNSSASLGEESPVPAKLDRITSRVLTDQERSDASEMISRDLRRRRDRANSANLAEWRSIENRAQWEAYRDERLARLEKSLGSFPKPPEKLNVHLTRRVKGDGYQIENLLYESRPGQWVPANLYLPATTPKSMPGLILVHSHHRDKWQGELQDMGMTWARAGCAVLVIDQVGYGERRAHPFDDEDDYAKEFRVSRQDYYHRYDSGIQLQLAGDSLMGWFVWDLRRGVDLLLARPGIDPKRIIILGAVAGGGDPCAVTATLDQRIAGAVPFNFGGPQPETRYPLPDDPEESFNYLAGTYWDSTRGLRRSGVDGYFHWLIVGGIAPRPLIYAHEFAWDRENDPVWKRFERIWGEFYNARDHLAGMSGKGSVKGRPPTSTHCTNIGKYHRQFIHPHFREWFDIPVSPKDEYSNRRPTAELTCLTPEARKELKPATFVDLVSQVGEARLREARAKLAKLSLAQRREQLRRDWRELLGPIEPDRQLRSRVVDSESIDPNTTVERVVLSVEEDITIPMIVLRPTKPTSARMPVVIGLAQSGKEGFLKHRAKELADLVARGCLVCLPDVRGTGESKAGTSRGRTSGDGDRSVRMLLFDQTMLGQRLRDTRSVIRYLQQRDDVDGQRIALWGDSFAPINSAKTDFQVPRGVGGRPAQSEPLGGLLALLGALYEDDVRAVYVHRGLSGYASVLTFYQVFIPHDVVIPHVLTQGDLSDLTAVLAPRPVRLEALVDGQNRVLSAKETSRLYSPAVRSYEASEARSRLTIPGEQTNIAAWIGDHLSD